MRSGPAYSIMKTVRQAIWAPETKLVCRSPLLLSHSQHTEIFHLNRTTITQPSAIDRDILVIWYRFAIVGICYPQLVY